MSQKNCRHWPFLEVHSNKDITNTLQILKIKGLNKFKPERNSKGHSYLRKNIEIIILSIFYFSVRQRNSLASTQTPPFINDTAMESDVSGELRVSFFSDHL